MSYRGNFPGAPSGLPTWLPTQQEEEEFRAERARKDAAHLARIKFESAKTTAAGLDLGREECVAMMAEQRPNAVTTLQAPQQPAPPPQGWPQQHMYGHPPYQQYGQYPAPYPAPYPPQYPPQYPAQHQQYPPAQYQQYPPPQHQQYPPPHPAYAPAPDPRYAGVQQGYGIAEPRAANPLAPHQVQGHILAGPRVETLESPERGLANLALGEGVEENSGALRTSSRFSNVVSSNVVAQSPAAASSREPRTLTSQTRGPAVQSRRAEVPILREGLQNLARAAPKEASLKPMPADDEEPRELEEPLELKYAGRPWGDDEEIAETIRLADEEKKKEEEKRAKQEAERQRTPNTNPGVDDEVTRARWSAAAKAGGGNFGLFGLQSSMHAPANLKKAAAASEQNPQQQPPPRPAATTDAASGKMPIGTPNPNRQVAVKCKYWLENPRGCTRANCHFRHVWVEGRDSPKEKELWQKMKAVFQEQQDEAAAKAKFRRDRGAAKVSKERVIGSRTRTRRPGYEGQLSRSPASEDESPDVPIQKHVVDYENVDPVTKLAGILNVKLDETAKAEPKAKPKKEKAAEKPEEKAEEKVEKKAEEKVVEEAEGKADVVASPGA